jgi:hypothetical protein
LQDINDFKRFLRTDPDASAFLRDSRADAPITLTRAPGRLDVMGGVADYSGSLVAEPTKFFASGARALKPNISRRKSRFL